MEKKKEEPKGFMSRVRKRMQGKKKEKEEPKEEIKEKPKEETKEEPKEAEPKREVSMREEVKNISEQLKVFTQEDKVKKQLKKKQFKMPFKVKSQLKKLAMKNKVQVILLQNNRNMKPTIGEIREGMLLVGDKETKIHNGSPDFIWLWDGKFPTVILPEWDLNPITATALVNDAVENKRLADPQTIIIRAIQYAETLQSRNAISGKAWIWMGIGAIVLFYLLFAGE